MTAPKTVTVFNNQRSMVAVHLDKPVEYETGGRVVESADIEIPRRPKGEHVSVPVVVRESVWSEIAKRPAVSGLIASGALQVV